MSEIKVELKKKKIKGKIVYVIVLGVIFLFAFVTFVTIKSNQLYLANQEK